MNLARGAIIVLMIVTLISLAGCAPAASEPGPAARVVDPTSVLGVDSRTFATNHEGAQNNTAGFTWYAEQQTDPTLMGEIMQFASFCEMIAASSTVAEQDQEMDRVCDPALVAAAPNVARVLLVESASLRQHPPSSGLFAVPRNRQTLIDWSEKMAGVLSGWPSVCSPRAAAEPATTDTTDTTEESPTIGEPAAVSEPETIPAPYVPAPDAPLPLPALAPGSAVFEHGNSATILTPGQGATFVNRMGSAVVIQPPHGAATFIWGQ